MKSNEEESGLIAQWVINNRYPRPDKERMTDTEMYHLVKGKIESLIREAQEVAVNLALNMACDHLDHGEKESFEVDRGGILHLQSQIIHEIDNPSSK